MPNIFLDGFFWSPFEVLLGRAPLRLLAPRAAEPPAALCSCSPGAAGGGGGGEAAGFHAVMLGLWAGATPFFFFFSLIFSSPRPPSFPSAHGRRRPALPGAPRPGHGRSPPLRGRGEPQGSGAGGSHAAGPAAGLAAAGRAMPQAAELGRRRGHHPQQRPQEAQLHLPHGAAPALHLGARYRDLNPRKAA